MKPFFTHSLFYAIVFRKLIVFKVTDSFFAPEIMKERY